jgi:hypothetical protein
VVEDIGVEVFVPLAVILWAAVLYLGRHKIAAWLGWGSDE